jgi:UDP-2,3-diacylglucosamine pyrophosphatase LpxH
MTDLCEQEDMRPWMPDWRKLMEEAQRISVEPEGGFLYIIADSHLGDARAPVGEFFAMLKALPEARLVVFLGDLFRVWLALPKFWDAQVRSILEGFAALRAAGVPILFVVGNREFFLPAEQSGGRVALPFDHIVHGACVLEWGAHRYGLTHGDIINREDRQHLKWRRISRSRGFEWVFRLMPGGMARAVASWLERKMANTNREIKVTYPLGEIEAFAGSVLGDLDGFFVGHFHRDETVPVPDKRGALRIVPDWHSRKALLRVAPNGSITRLHFSAEAGGLEE